MTDTQQPDGEPDNLIDLEKARAERAETPEAVVEDVAEDVNDAIDVDSVDELLKQDSSAIKLSDLLKRMKAVAKPTTKDSERIRMINTTLSFLAANLPFDKNYFLENCVVKDLRGKQVGEATNGANPFAVIAPELIQKGDLEDFKHVEMHEFTHIAYGLLSGDIKDEALTELITSLRTGDDPKDYKNEVANMQIILHTIGNGDMEKGFKRVVTLVKEDDYNKMYKEFSDEYKKAHPEKMKKNDDTAYNLFQLAFPRLKDDEDGFEEDEDTFDDAEIA